MIVALEIQSLSGHIIKRSPGIDMNCEPNVHNAIVYDLGSASFLAGHAGDYMCNILTPGIAAVIEGRDPHFSFLESDFYSTTDGCELLNLVDESYTISDPDLLAKYLLHTHQGLGVTAEETSVLYSQPGHLIGDHNQAWQKTLAEISFETLRHKKVSISSDAVLATYAHCLQTALVLDFGWSCVRVIPVVEGHPVAGAVQVHPIGGYALARILQEQLQKRHVSVFPRMGELSEAQHHLQEKRICADIIQTCCSFAPSTIDEDFLYFLQERPLQVPFEMNLIAAIHFNELSGDGNAPVMSLPAMIQEAIRLSPDYAKRLLWQNIVTAGGFSGMTALISRLQSEMRTIADPVFTVNVQFPVAERCGGVHTVWTGGSIFASSHVFPRFCITKDEWAEHGESVVHVKCI